MVCVVGDGGDGEEENTVSRALPAESRRVRLFCRGLAAAWAGTWWRDWVWGGGWAALVLHGGGCGLQRVRWMVETSEDDVGSVHWPADPCRDPGHPRILPYVLHTLLYVKQNATPAVHSKTALCLTFRPAVPVRTVSHLLRLARPPAPCWVWPRLRQWTAAEDRLWGPKKGMHGGPSRIDPIAFWQWPGAHCPSQTVWLAVRLAAWGRGQPWAGQAPAL